MQEIKKISSLRGRKIFPGRLDRLSLDRLRIKSTGRFSFCISRLKDPIGEALETIKRPNGLLIKKGARADRRDTRNL